MSSTGAHGSPLLNDEDQVQNVTIAVKEMLSLFTAVTVEDGEHALKKLHRSIIDAVYTDLVRRMTSEYRLTEAVKTNSEQLPGSLARSIIIALKNADHKGCESEEKSRKDNGGKMGPNLLGWAPARPPRSRRPEAFLTDFRHELRGTLRPHVPHAPRCAVALLSR
ncbi:hypothetical protein MHYP_G00131030 [Metynnis hypsauchen]